MPDLWQVAAADIRARWDHGHAELTDGCALCHAEFADALAWAHNNPQDAA